MVSARLDEDVFVIADAVLHGVDHSTAVLPPGSLVEGDSRGIVDADVQLEVLVAHVCDHRFTVLEEVPADTSTLVIGSDEQVNQVMAADRDVADRLIVDHGDLRGEPGTCDESIVELPAGVAHSGSGGRAGRELRGEGRPNAAVVVRRDCGGVTGPCRAGLDRLHEFMLSG